MKELDKTYNPQNFEQKWYDFWIAQDYFKPSEKNKGENYCIVIPPPNVTGSLHMGHALNNTLQDILIRFKRMKGFRTLWQCGTDHAGIATQNVVERQLSLEKKSRFDLGRDEFVKQVWKWKEQYGDIIVNQLKKLGASCDWSRQRFTMDEGCSRAVRRVFVSLYREGLIYRGNRLINWCPRCHTALSDLEAEHEEIDGNLYHIKYPSVEGDDFMTVATTRPETMLGDTAVAINPEDGRYAKWRGSMVLLPLMNRKIPVIADPYVDVSFGTGALKITPAHDPNDFEIGKKYSLDFVKVIGEDGKMTPDAGGYVGLDRFEARKKILKDLEEEGFLSKVEPYRHSVGHCYRCKNIVEPNLSLQWFVDVKTLAEKSVEAVKDARTRIIPSNWEKTYFEWMNNIRDWCISRQIWWGHRIPAWYCKSCDFTTVEMQDPERCSKCGSTDIEQDSDVLDTWFSSALWPFSTLGWPDKTPELESFYPTSCLVTGFDILFFWVARMMMMGLKFMGDVPFRDVYIHALVRDAYGHKMSKSKGNVIDPLQIIDRYGADSFRFTLSAMAAQGRDIRLSEERIEGYRHFANKIWNASRFVLMNMKDYEQGFPEKDNLSLKDRWIMSRLARVTGLVSESLDAYRFNDASHTLYQFVWHEFCDWYIEMAKPDIYNKEDRQKSLETMQVIIRVLKTILELLHPFMPFVTEEIWQKLPGAGESIMIERFPEFSKDDIDETSEQHTGFIIQAVSAVRNIRSEMNVAPSARPRLDILCSDDITAQALSEQSEMISSLSGVGALAVHRQFSRPKAAAAAVIERAEIFLSLEGIIDFKEELKRLEKEMKKVCKDIDFVEGRLSNQGFVSRAPAEVIEKEKEKSKAYREKADKLSKNMEVIRGIL